MNVRLKRLLDEIDKTEERIAQWQEHLKTLNVRRKQIEDAEIIKSIRSMKLDSRKLSEVLDDLQNGRIPEVYADTIRDDKETDYLEEHEPLGTLTELNGGNDCENED